MTAGTHERVAPSANAHLIDLGGVAIDCAIRGEGEPLLLLASEEQRERDLPLIDDLARRYRVIMPAAPGFGVSPRPDWMTDPDDIAYVFLDLVDRLALKNARVLGFSLGGWIAAEMAVKSSAFIARMALVGALGVKHGGPSDVDIQDIWTQHPTRVESWLWRDPAKGKRDFATWSDEALAQVARNTESFARFCWAPYMHNPKLAGRLHRIQAPTLLIWGDNDGFVAPDYGRAYAARIPGARFEAIAQAGHFPHIEQPDAFARALRGFFD